MYVPLLESKYDMKLKWLLKVPVILVGNKIDLRSGEVSNHALEEEIVPIMNEFKVCCSNLLASPA